MSDRFRQIARNIFSNYVTTIVGGLIFIALTPFVVNQLGTLEYGLWVLLNTISYFVHYFNFGLDDAQLKYHAEFDGQRDTSAINRLLSTNLSVHVLIGLFGCCLALGFSQLPLDKLFNVPEESTTDFSLLLMLLGIYLLISFPASMVSGIFSGYQRFDIDNAIDLSFAVVGALATIGVLLLGYGVVGLAVLQIVMGLADLVVSYLVVRRVFPEVRLRLLEIDRALWNKLRSFGLWSFLDDLTTEGLSQLDKLILPIFFSVALLTPFSLAMALATLVLFISEPITDLFFPMASELRGRSRFDELRRLLRDGTRAVIAVATPTAMVVLVFGDAILTAWVGERFAELPPLIVPLIAVNMYLSALFWPATSLLLGMGHVRQVFWFTVIETVLGIIAILLLAPRFGITGFVVAFLLSNIVSGILLTLPAVCRRVGQPLLPYIASGILRPLLACLPAALAAMAIGVWLQPTSIPALAATLGAILAVHTLSFGSLGLSSSERGQVMHELRARLGAAG